MLSVKYEVFENREVPVINARAVNRVAMEVAKSSVCRHSEHRGVKPHRELARRLIVTVSGKNLTSYIVRPDMAKSSVAQITTRVEEIGRAHV